jgi:hypothetical protein
MQIDFRRVYTDILNDWFGTAKTTIDSLLFRNFNSISLLSDFVETVGNGNWNNRDVWSVRPKSLNSEYVKINPEHTVTVGQENIRLEENWNFTGDYKVNVLG